MDPGENQLRTGSTYLSLPPQTTKREMLNTKSNTNKRVLDRDPKFVSRSKTSLNLQRGQHSYTGINEIILLLGTGYAPGHFAV